jgi:hypothetical protein
MAAAREKVTFISVRGFLLRFLPGIVAFKMSHFLFNLDYPARGKKIKRLLCPAAGRHSSRVSEV